MTTKTTRGLLTAALLTTAAVAAGPAYAQLNDRVAAKLNEVQKDFKAGDIQGAKAAVEAAKQIGGRSANDDYAIAKLEIPVDAQLKDMAGATVAAQSAADNPKQPKADIPGNLQVAIELSLFSKQNDKAIAYAKKLAAMNPTDPKQIGDIGDAYYFGQDFPDAKTFAQAQIDAATKAGKTPGDHDLQVLMAAQAGLKDEAGAEVTLETLLLDYNNPADWAQMIDIAFGTPGLRDQDAIWLGRLLFLTGAPVSQNTGNMIGSIASHLTFFGDAVNAKAHGGKVDPDPAPRAEEDKKTIPQQIAAEDAQKGDYSAKLAEALYSYGMYPEAEAAATKAIAKGGNSDPSEAPMVLGQAQTAQGKYDDALASFGKVTGGGPATARITKLWVDYVNIKKKPPVAAAAAAPAK